MSNIRVDDMLDYLRLKTHINTTYLPLLSEEQIADLTTLMIIGRQSNQYHAEDYEKELERNIRDARQNKNEAFNYIFYNTLALIYIRRALKRLGCKKLSVESHFNY